MASGPALGLGSVWAWARAGRRGGRRPARGRGAARQDPPAPPAPSPTWMGRDGMGSPMGPGMMGGQMGPGMMGGQGGAGMMTADHLEQMTALHDRMAESGACDPALMQEL